MRFRLMVGSGFRVAGRTGGLTPKLTLLSGHGFDKKGSEYVNHDWAGTCPCDGFTFEPRFRAYTLRSEGGLRFS